MTPFQEGEANEDMSSKDPISKSDTSANDIVGPITRSRSKKLEKEIQAQVNANLYSSNSDISGNMLLSYSSFMILRNDGLPKGI